MEADEIVARLNKSNRWTIIHQIMTSILLTNTPINGNSGRTLLPLSAGEIQGLYELWQARLNGLHSKPIPLPMFLHQKLMSILVTSELDAHISRFAFYHAFDNLEFRLRPYRQLFEDLFQPYFKPGLEKNQRLRDLDRVLRAAIAHGMKGLDLVGEPVYEWTPGPGTPEYEMAPALKYQIIGFPWPLIEHTIFEPYCLVSLKPQAQRVA